MIRVFFIFVLVLFSSADLWAQGNVLTVDLAQDHVDITTGFDGAHLSLFGVKNNGGQVAVVIKGPLRDALVRKKSSILGAWMNRQSLKYEDVPGFYDYALSDAEDNILSADLRREAGIGFEALKFSPEKSKLKPDALKEFQQALVRNKQAEKLFPVVPKDVVFLSDTFFKTEFYVPSNVPIGQYVIETFLIKDGNILDKRVTNVRVAQIGFSSGVYRFAHSYSFAYALIIVFIAVVAGWLSNVVRKNNN